MLGVVDVSCVEVVVVGIVVVVGVTDVVSMGSLISSTIIDHELRFAAKIVK